MLRYVQASDHEQAASAARSDLLAAAGEISRRAYGLDLITVVSSARVDMIMSRAVTGSEPAAALLELIALVLTCRDSRGGVVSPLTAQPEFQPPAVVAAAQDALEAGSLIALFESPSGDAESAILFFSIQREISLRNPVYPHMLLDTLRGLFGDPVVNEDCTAAMGFAGIEAVNVMEALASLTIKRVEDRFARMEAARDASLPHLRSWQRQRESGHEDPSEQQRAAMQEVVDALEDLTTNIAEAFIIDIDIDAVAAHTGYPRTTVEAVLDAFTVSDLTDIDEALDRFFRGDNPLRTAPVVTDGQGRRMLAHEALALPAVREVMEAGLKSASRSNAYEKRRGAWVEKTAIDLLEQAFPGAKVYRGFNYFVPDPDAASPQTDPREFTKRVEGDGLIIVDDVALVIEVKSVALTAEARGGVARRLRGKLRDIVTNAANQATRLRDRVAADQQIRLDNDEWIDLSRVREIHTIAVGLEDLSGVTTATLVTAGLLSPDSIPWTVSVHDLRIVTELLDRPSELLLYLRRRTHPEATVKYRAVDELDLFLLFLNRGLYVEPDPRQVAQALSWAGPPSPADLRRYEEQQPEIIDSYTEPMDAWYNSHLIAAAPPADKPRLKADESLLELVDQVNATGSPGWLATSTWLLEGNAKVQRKMGRHAADLAKRVRADRRRHTATHLIGDPSGKHVLLVWACLGRGEDVDEAAAFLMRYLSAKKHQTAAYQAACMVFDSSGKHLLRLLYDNRLAESDRELDREVTRLGLVPVEQMSRLR